MNEVSPHLQIDPDSRPKSRGLGVSAVQAEDLGFGVEGERTGLKFTSPTHTTTTLQKPSLTPTQN